ncbi:MAG: hypothetical protein RJA61_424 [Candidatus Parcubacteria bacterium]|jgi:hypothetical protein
MKNIIIGILVVGVIGFGIYMFTRDSADTVVVLPAPVDLDKDTPAPVVEVDKTKTVIGRSVEGKDIVAYHFGDGAQEILFVGGIHGGYEWNTVLVAGQLMDYLKTNPSVVPSNVKVTVVPVLNPDGLLKVVGTTTARFSQAQVSSSQDEVVSGRFNANNVDLNRNFDCDWQTSGKWQTKTVSGGSEVFSEPESQAIKGYLEKNKIEAAVVWYSAAGGVFASSCHNGVSSETSTLTKKFADASGYPAYQSFDFYATTGDMVNWMAKNSIPAISVLLTNHTDTEWKKNQAGVDALLKYYSQQ